MATKKLRAQLEALEAENSRLEDELRQLSDRRGATDHVLESSSVLEAHRQATEDFQAELSECHERNQQLEQWNDELQAQLQRLTTDSELDKLRAVEDERAKWEVREDRLVRQLRELEERLATAIASSRNSPHQVCSRDLCDPAK